MSCNHPATQNLEKRALAADVWRAHDRDGIESHLGLKFITENHKVPDTNYDLGHSHTTVLTASWKRQNIETELRPENGYYLNDKIGAALGSLSPSAAMARAVTKAGYFFIPENKKIGTFIVRGQAGYAYAREGKEVPFSLELRTGGTSSVRGYKLNGIGRTGPNGSILPERALLMGSLEYQFPLTKSLSGVVFHDMGDTAVNFGGITMRYGMGLGVRWFSPAAPSTFDIAYDHQDKKIRWHISLGTRFWCPDDLCARRGRLPEQAVARCWQYSIPTTT